MTPTKVSCETRKVAAEEWRGEEGTWESSKHQRHRGGKVKGKGGNETGRCTAVTNFNPYFGSV
jgi:hypothetical protein